MTDRNFTTVEVLGVPIALWLTIDLVTNIWPPAGGGFYWAFFILQWAPMGWVIGNWWSRRKELLEWFDNGDER